MTLQEALQRLDTFEQTRYAYQHAMGVLSVDGVTAAPSASSRGRGETMALLSEVTYKQLTDPATADMLHTLLDHASELPQKTRRQAEELFDSYQETTCIPLEEYVAYSRLLNDADAVWHQAKADNDFPAFAPYLAQLVTYARRFAGYRDTTKAPYDVLLDQFEKGTSMATLDPFFAALREKLSPLILAIAEKPEPRTDFLHQLYPVEDQRRFSARLMALMGIDSTRCTLTETEHPFTDGFNRWDVRITTHYFDHDVASSMYSVIHEGGHALYELGVGENVQFTCLAGGSSMGIHESQSRFYENLIGRSYAFCQSLVPIMWECFPQQMAGIDAETLYRAVNLVKPSLIRTEADELTYAQHIMVRYELEKQLFTGTLAVNDLPQAWNDMYRAYLGVTVPNDREGVLQDSHWSGGAFGYFPSYALGSAYGAQMLHRMKQELDVDAIASGGDLTPITAWLGEKIHHYGRLLTPAQLLESACGGPFEPHYFVDYLTEKYTALYRL